MLFNEKKKKFARDFAAKNFCKFTEILNNVSHSEID